MTQEITPTPKRNIVSRIFISTDEPRLRAGWRLLIQTILLFVLGIVVSFIGLLFKTSTSATTILNQILNLIAITGSVYIARRWLDKRSFESLGLKLNRQTGIDILAGIGITFVQMGFIYFVMLGLGWLTFTGFAWQFDPIGTVDYRRPHLLCGLYHRRVERGIALTWLPPADHRQRHQLILGCCYFIGCVWIAASRQSQRDLGQRGRHFLCRDLSRVRLYPHKTTLALDWTAHRLEFL